MDHPNEGPVSWREWSQFRGEWADHKTFDEDTRNMVNEIQQSQARTEQAVGAIQRSRSGLASVALMLGTALLTILGEWFVRAKG